MSLKKNLKWSSIGVIFRYIFQTASIIILARLLTPEEFGIVSSALIVVNFLVVLSQLGSCQLVVTSEKIHYNKILFHALIFSLTLSILFLMLILFYANNISYFITDTNIGVYISIASLIIIPKSIAVVFEGVLIRNSDFKYLAYLNILTYVLGYFFVALILSYNDFGAMSLIIASITQAFIFLLLIFHRAYTKFDLYFEKNLSLMKNSFNVAFSVSSTQLLSNTTSQIDNIIVSKFLGLEVLGIYTRAYQLTVIPCNLIGQVINRSFLQYFSSGSGQAKKNNVIKMSLIFSFFFSAFFVVSFNIFDDEIVFLLLGEAWGDVTYPLTILSLTIFPRMLYKIAEPILFSSGNANRMAVYSLVYLLVVALLSLYLVPYGMAGVSIGVLAGTIIYGMLAFHKVSKLNNQILKYYIITIIFHFLLAFWVLAYV
ncbi:oligosaccharide flippase family protein [Vibrio metschnikovii]|nr:oligosaccharide flippase family protein [Vibrio metschnikovii]